MKDERTLIQKTAVINNIILMMIFILGSCSNSKETTTNYWTVSDSSLYGKWNKVDSIGYCKYWSKSKSIIINENRIDVFFDDFERVPYVSRSGFDSNYNIKIIESGVEDIFNIYSYKIIKDTLKIKSTEILQSSKFRFDSVKSCVFIKEK